MNTRITKVKNLYRESAERYGIVTPFFVTFILVYKVVRKGFMPAKLYCESLMYSFFNNKYNMSYLTRITGIRTENKLWSQLKNRKNRFLARDTTSLVAGYDEAFPGTREVKRARAAAICSHFFNLMGSGNVKIDKTFEARKVPSAHYRLIDWQLDFKSGHRWGSRTFFRRIEPGKDYGADIIVPLELSRFQDRMVLAQEYLLSGQSKYAYEFQNQVEDWIDNNKPGFGVNWYFAMDTAIRAANWIVIKELIETRFDFSEDFLIRFYCSIYDHGKFIRKHLPNTGKAKTNHYIAAISGLLLIAVYCPFLKNREEWIEFSIKELEKEIKNQVYPDGCDYEASTSYHLLVLELFFYTLLLCDRAGIYLSEAYKSRVRNMFKCVIYYLKPDGTAPQIGDNDNGRFFKYCFRPVLNHKY